MSNHDTIAALKAERAGYARYGRDDRAKQVDQQISLLENGAAVRDVETADVAKPATKKAPPKKSAAKKES